MAAKNEPNTMDRIDVLAALRNVEQIPQRGKYPKHRTIYETQHGTFSIDYAAFPGGDNRDVPLSVIQELVSEGTIVPKHPNDPRVKMWFLAEIAR